MMLDKSLVSTSLSPNMPLSLTDCPIRLALLKKGPLPPYPSLIDTSLTLHILNSQFAFYH